MSCFGPFDVSQSTSLYLYCTCVSMPQIQNIYHEAYFRNCETSQLLFIYFEVNQVESHLLSLTY